MALTYIPAVAAFSGSATGALATILTSWIRQRRQHRVHAYVADHLQARRALQKLH